MLLVRAPLVFGHLKLTAPPLWLAVALPIAYFTAAVVTVSLFTHNTPIWISNSLVVTALLRNRRSTWPALLCLVVLADYAQILVTAEGMWVVGLGIVVCDISEILLVATLSGFTETASLEESVWPIARLALVSLLVPMVSATGGAALLNLALGVTFGDGWKNWYLATASGLVIVTPLLLCWTDRRLRTSDWRRVIPETLLLAGLVAIVGYLDFRDAVPGLFLVFPFLLLTTFQGRLLGATTAAAAVATVAIWSTFTGHGPIATFAGTNIFAKIHYLQLYIAVVLLSVLPLAALLGHREKLAAQLRTFAETLEERVKERTRQLQAENEARRQTEAALRQREARIRRLVDSNIIGIFIWDYDGRVLEANDEFLRMVNYDREDLIAGRITWTNLMPPDWRDRNNARIEQQKSSGRFNPIEKEYMRRDGSRVPVLSGGATFEQGGNQGVAFVLDLTDRKRAEQALMRSEAYLIETQKLTHTGSWAWDARNQKVLYCSEEMLRIFGLDPREDLPTRKNFRQRVHPEDRNRVDESFARVVNERVDSFDEYRVVLPDGTVKHVYSSGHPVLDANGELTEFVGTATDVTERKRAEEALRESEAKFRDYAETASDWLWETDPDYKFTLLTENAFGSDPTQRIGTMCWDHALDVETEPEKWRFVWSTLDAHKSFRDFVYCTMDGSGAPMYVKASGKPVFDSSGKFCGYRGTGIDVTAIVRGQRAEASLRTVQAELAHVSRVMTLGQLTASIAHEVNQPIGSARNNARAALNFLDRSPPDLGEVREALGCIVADADRAGGIIDRIRDQIKKAPPRNDCFDFNQAIEEVIGLAQSTTTENAVSVQTRLASGMAPVHGDRVQLQQVVLNLILNAVEAMSSVKADERELLISTEQDRANGTLVAVRDSGLGIDPKHLERVFEPFYSTKSGMGMGLSICRSIITAHGGRLWAAANERRGALFQFTLPGVEAKPSIVGAFTALESGKKTSP